MSDKNKEEILEDVLEDLEHTENPTKTPLTEQQNTDGTAPDAQPQEATEEAQTDKEEADKEEEDKEPASKGILKKKKKTDKKQEAMEEKVTDLEDRVKRQMAEFENFRKRTEKEKATMFEMGAKSVIEKMLPVVDNFERGLQAIPEGEEKTPFAEGMSMIYKQLMTELDSLGVKPIEAVGKEFNPDLHNAVMQVESEEYGEGIVAQELQKGYTYRESVVRHSMVAVSQ